MARHPIPPCPSTVPERVEYIRRLLQSGEWDHHSSTPRLCDAWDLSYDAIHHYRKKAGKLVDYGDRPDTVELRVRAITQMMEDFEWQGHKTIAWLKDRWMLSEPSIRQYAAEASRYFTADASEARRDISQGCRELFLKAVEDGDAKAAHFAGQLWARVSGADAQQITHTLELSAKTPALARQTMAELFGSVGGGIKQLASEPETIEVEASEAVEVEAASAPTH